MPFLMGDLNCDMISTRSDNNTLKLMSMAHVYGLQQLISEPTQGNGFLTDKNNSYLVYFN